VCVCVCDGVRICFSAYLPRKVLLLFCLRPLVLCLVLLHSAPQSPQSRLDGVHAGNSLPLARNRDIHVRLSIPRRRSFSPSRSLAAPSFLEAQSRAGHDLCKHHVSIRGPECPLTGLLLSLPALSPDLPTDLFPSLPSRRATLLSLSVLAGAGYYLYQKVNGGSGTSRGGYTGKYDPKTGLGRGAPGFREYDRARAWACTGFCCSRACAGPFFGVLFLTLIFTRQYAPFSVYLPIQ
jgi:hypothetical protein